MILPNHPQLYPDQLLPHRLEEYVLDGAPPTRDRRAAKLLTGVHVRDVVVAAQARLGLANIDPRYFVATCFHEAGCTNEWDTEVATASNPTGFTSVGAYQLSADEAQRYGYKLVDMLDLTKATECMIMVAEHNRHVLREYAGITGDDPPDMRAYLALGHNQGLGAARKTITAHGMDWDAYRERNPGAAILKYGDDCISGGPEWPG